ncbi:MAG TPA: ABC transporter ATP-binding protein, partial [Anaerolineae bacterium]
ADGTSILVTTHYMDEAENCHRLAFIHQGRVIAEGTPTTMKEPQTFGAQVVEMDCAPLDSALTILRDAHLFDEVALYGSTLHAIGADAADKIPQARARLQANGVTVTRAEAIAPSLEDVFIARLRRAAA